jgi:hypothetical protein
MLGIDFKKLRGEVRNLGEKIKAMQSESDSLQRERETVMSAPGSKEDLKAMLGAWIDSAGDAYRIRMQETLTKFARSPRNMTPATLAQILSITGDGLAYDKEAQTKHVDQALCALFGSLVNKALMKEVDGMDWPATAITNADRAARVADLDERINKLETDIRQLIDQAEEAGVTWSR